MTRQAFDFSTICHIVYCAIDAQFRPALDDPAPEDCVPTNPNVMHLSYTRDMEYCRRWSLPLQRPVLCSGMSATNQRGEQIPLLPNAQTRLGVFPL
eukprot:2909816-Amphidinium_carterae.1